MCTSPLRAFYTGSKTEKGGDLLAISKSFAGLNEIRYEVARKSCREPFEINFDYMYQDSSGYWQLYKFVDVPCGHCDECLLAYKKHWADRCLMEMQDSHDNYFVTLTYSESDGSLHKRDFQLFMKRLRKIVGPGVRFFACGEYGSVYHRPHYHAVLFNCPLNVDGFSSLELRSAWPFGFVRVEPCLSERCAYVAGYTAKKLLDWKVPEGFEDPFILMSRRPGIGERYLRSHKDQIDSVDKIYLPNSKGVQAITPPRYYYKLLEKDGFSVIDQKDSHQVAAYLSELTERGNRNLDHEGVLRARRLIAEERRKKSERNLQ